MNIQGIERFMRRYNQAVQQGSKDFVFTMQQASDLASSISELLASHATLINPDTNNIEQQTISISVDGGGFK